MDTPKTDIIYSSVFDPVVFQKHMAVRRTKQWKRIVLAGLLAGLLAFLVFLFFYAVWFVGSPIFGINRALLLALAFALLAGIYCVWTYVVNTVNEEIKSVRGKEQATCRITDEGFEVTRQSGFRVFIPWNTIKLEYETPGAFQISYESNQPFVVFRKPLQDANAESEFLSRIPR